MTVLALVPWADQLEDRIAAANMAEGSDEDASDDDDDDGDKPASKPVTKSGCFLVLL